MKKTKRALGIILAMSMAVMTFSGCSGGGNSSAPTGDGSQAESGPQSSGSSYVPRPGDGGDPNEGTPKSGGTMRIAALRDAGGLDPHLDLGSGSLYVMGNCYDTLVEFDEVGGYRGALAESWEQPNDMTYLFHLRKGVKFHDGTDFNADDVIATFERILDPESKAATRPNFLDVAIEKVDDYTVKFTRTSVDAGFLDLFARSNCHIISDEDWKNGYTFKDGCNGTGPFILKSWEASREYVFEKNPNYWKEGLPYLDGWILYPVPETSTRVNMLLAGEAEFAESIPYSDFDRVGKDYDLLKQYAQSFLRVNTNVAPFDNVKFRQAVAFILDRDEIAMLCWGDTAKATTFGTLMFEGDYWYDDLDNLYPTNHEKANELLKECGYNSPADVPAFQITSTQTPNNNDLAMVVLQQLKNFGFNVELRSIDAPTLMNVRATGDYTLLQEGATWNMPGTALQWFHSQRGSSHAVGAKYKNEELDRLLEEGVATLDLAKRKEIYHEVYRILSEDLPIIYEIQRPSASAKVHELKGYVLLPDYVSGYSFDRMEYLWLDK